MEKDQNTSLIDLSLVRDLTIYAMNPKTPQSTRQMVFVANGKGDVKMLEIPAIHELPLPDHIRQLVRFVGRESFTRYVNEYQRSDAQIFASVTMKGASFVAALDYHESGVDGKPHQNKHIAFFDPAFSDEFAAWSAIHRKNLNQDDFLEFIRQWAYTITSATEADLLEVMSNLEFTTNGQFSSKVERTMGGRKLLFNEVTEPGRGGQEPTTASKTMTFPDSLQMKSEIFRNGVEFEYSADILYRISGGKLTITVELKRPHIVIRKAIESLITDISNETGLVPLVGTIEV